MSAVELRVDWCSYQAAKYAVENWHYSRRMPRAKIVTVGAWEDNVFIGSVLFNISANNNLGSPYELKQTEVCELVRVALTAHKSEVTKIVATALRRLKTQSPGLRLVVSYADPKQGHIGVIYQAMNWIYVGESQAQRELIVNGEFMHKRTASSRWGTASPEKIRKMERNIIVDYGPIEWKYTYLYPLDRAMRRQIAPLAQPYPKRETCGQSIEGDTVDDQSTGQVRSLLAAQVK